MILQDYKYRTVGVMDGDDCKDLDYNILGHVVGNEIQHTDHSPYGYLYFNEIQGKDGSSWGYVYGNDVQDTNGDTIGHVKAGPGDATSDIARAGAALFCFFDLRREVRDRIERERAEKERVERERVENEKKRAEMFAECNKAIESNPNYAPAYYNRGLIHLQLGELDQACSSFKKAIELDPNDADSHAGLGFVYDRRKQYPEAISSFSRAIELDPNNANAYSTRAINYLKSDQYDEAISDYTKVIELDPKNADAYYQRGLAYLKKEQWDIVCTEMDNLLRIDPAHNEAKELRAEALRKAEGLRADKLRELAEQGDADAQYEAGLAYLTGQGPFPKLVVKAEELIRKAAAQGHVQAKDYLAREEERKAREAKEAAERAEREAKEAAERKEREEREAAKRAEREAKERRRQFLRKTGRVAAAVLAVTSVIMFFNGLLRVRGSNLGVFLLLEILSITPFLIVYFCRGWVKKSIFFCGGIAWSVFLLQEVSDGRPLIFIAAIGFIVSYIIAMISPRK